MLCTAILHQVTPILVIPQSNLVEYLEEPRKINDGLDLELVAVIDVQWLDLICRLWRDRVIPSADHFQLILLVVGQTRQQPKFRKPEVRSQRLHHRP